MEADAAAGRPLKIMGADLAASPHCPFASDLAWKARPFAPGDFEGRKPRQAPAPLPPESERSRSSIRFPRGLPVRAEALAVRLLADSKPKLLFPLWRFLRPKPVVPLAAGSRAEAPVPPDKSMSLKLWVLAGSQPPGRNPVLPDEQEAEAPFPPVAARWPRPRFRLGRS